MAKDYPRFEKFLSGCPRCNIKILIDQVSLNELEHAVLLAIYFNRLTGKACVNAVSGCTSEAHVTRIKKSGREKIERFLTENPRFLIEKVQHTSGEGSVQ